MSDVMIFLYDFIADLILTMCLCWLQISTWLQEHDEMINSSNSWLTEAQSWLTAPCTYTTAKDLASYVHALQVSTAQLLPKTFTTLTQVKCTTMKCTTQFD